MTSPELTDALGKMGFTGIPAPGATPTTKKPPRQPLDPITNLWRKARSKRTDMLLPFVDHNVKVERWYGRTPDSGDEQYRGVVVAVAISTTGTTADFLILKTTGGTTWAISVAQIAYLELIPKAAR